MLSMGVGGPAHRSCRAGRILGGILRMPLRMDSICFFITMGDLALVGVGAALQRHPSFLQATSGSEVTALASTLVPSSGRLQALEAAHVGFGWRRDCRLCLLLGRVLLVLLGGILPLCCLRCRRCLVLRLGLEGVYGGGGSACKGRVRGNRQLGSSEDRLATPPTTARCDGPTPSSSSSTHRCGCEWGATW